MAAHHGAMVRAFSRSRLVDAGLVAAVALVGLAVLATAPTPEGYREPSAFAAVLVLASAASLWWWRTAPLASLFAACGVFIVNIVAGYQVGITQYPAWIALYSVFALMGRSARLIALAALVITVATYAVADRGPIDVGAFVAIAIFGTLAALLGDATHNRRRLSEAQAREQDAMHDRVVLEERARLARELHDSLGHSVNVMVMQAGVGRHVFDERPEFAKQALEQIENVGRVALGELDAVLRVLRPTDGEQRAQPESATLAGLDALCDRIRATGRDVALQVDEVDLSPTAERAAYRIVQEALTNAARHSTSGPIEVSITRGGRDAVITVHNTGECVVGNGSGRGLVNMRERAHLEGGQLDVRTRRGWVPGPRQPSDARGQVMISVLLADDDVLVRQGLRVLLESADDLRVVAEAADGAEAVELAASTKPDVVVMDVRMSGGDGIEATREIASWPSPRPRVLVLTTFDLDEIVHDALEAGADGFLLKRTTPEELMDGIRTVAAGEALISAGLTRRLLAYVSGRKPANASPTLVVPLTSREAEVLRYLTEGLSNAEIAAELSIGHETVKTHLKRICMKTGTRDRTQAVVWAYQTGFVSST